jgi:hypothetical protein
MKTNLKLVFILVLFFPAGLLPAQRHHNFFYGSVLDESTRKPIPNVNITFEKIHTGTTTDEKGEFSFYIDSVPAMMLVSHLGYQAKRILLDKTSFSLTILLTPQAQVLKEVVISAKSEYEVFFRDRRFSVLDYEIDSGKVFLIVFPDKLAKSEVICKDQKGDTLARSGVLPFTPKKLFRDCLGFLHLLGNDSAYQVFRDNDLLDLIYPVSIAKFNEVLRDCVLSSDELLYFKKAENHGLGVDFYSIDRKSLKKQFISSFGDSARMKMLRRNPEDLSMMMRSRIPDSREDFVSYSFTKKILYRPISSYMYRIGDYLCIFNTTDATIEFHRPDGSYSYKLKLAVEKIPNGKWTKEILTDDIGKKAYTTFSRNGECSLYRIDLNNGELHLILSLFHSFPEKLKILQGYIYYLYSPAGPEGSKGVYRQRM